MESDIIESDIIEINIKILNEKYEIFLNKIFSERENIISYIGRNILYYDKDIIPFFIDNYKDIINISVVKKLFDEYNSIFFLTSNSYDKINLQCKYNSIGGIAHDTDFFIKIKP